MGRPLLPCGTAERARRARVGSADIVVESAITVRPARLEDLPLLDALGARPAGTHRRRLSLQRAEVLVYLVAQLDRRVAGHLMLTWAGMSNHVVASRISNCPAIIDLLVAPDLRCRGIGSRLIQEAERRASERGYPRIGLAVGTENTRARALYERHGFEDVGLGTFTIHWTEIDANGDEARVSETCVFLMKQFCAMGGPTSPHQGYRDRTDAGGGRAGVRR